MKTWKKSTASINPTNEQFNIRTRFKLALLSFGALTVVFTIAFFVAVRSMDLGRSEAFLNFAEHISYVLGAVVASYVGMESAFPSIGGYGWRGRHTGGSHGYGGNREHSGRTEDKKTPPVGLGEDDAEVD